MATQNPIGYFTVQHHARYADPALNARLFYGGNQAAPTAAFTAGLTTTYTGGLMIYNPLTSTSNVLIDAVSVSFIIALTTASTIGLGVGFHASTAPTTPGTALAYSPGIVGATTTAQAKLYSPTSSTLPAALTLVTTLKSVGTAAETAFAAEGNDTFDIGGGIVLQPGAYCCVVSLATGTASSFVGTFVWEENPIGSM